MHRTIILLLLLLLATAVVYSQPGAGFNRFYVLLHSGNSIADKNFYLLTAIQHDPAIKKVLAADVFFNEIHQRRVSLIKKHVTDTCSYPSSLLGGFRYDAEDSLAIIAKVAQLYKQYQPVFDNLTDRQLRPSGYYQRFANDENAILINKAFAQYIYGINYIIDQFGLGKKMRYPLIDSASYVVNSRYYRTVLKDMFGLLDEQTDSMNLFFEPSLAIAMHLMEANDRDEPARFEPIELGENKLALAKIKATDWRKFQYAAIVIPGNGPELASTPISPDNKIHCDAAAMRYLKGLAPFIITSGGYCYPFRGPYCEAVEMKKYLVTKYHIPEASIIIDPHARHTTTNFRNAVRLMYRYGIPTDRPDLFVTSKSQHDYTMNDLFDQRNLRELGYVPYCGKKSLSNHDIEFYPVIDCLHMDPLDSLDP